MPNDLVPPTQEQLDAERYRREAAEAEVARMAEIARSAVAGRGPTPSAAPAGPDPLTRFTTEAAQMSPEAASGLLDQGIRQRIDEATKASQEQVGRAVGQALFARDHQQAFDLVMSTNPDIAADEEGFAAASAKAELQLRKQNRRNVPAGEFFRLAVSKYREGNKEVTPVDHVEGASTGDGAKPPASAAPPPPPEVSAERLQLAEWYGMDPSEIQPFDKEGKVTLERLSHNYVEDRNDYLEAKGVYSNVPAVEMPGKQRRVDRKKKAAAAAAGG